MMTLSRVRLVVLLSAVLVGVSASAGTTPVDNLLAFFSSTCPSESGWTQAALGKAASLRTTLEDLSKDPDCQALSAEALSAGAITSSLTLLNEQIMDNAMEVSLASQEVAVLTSMSYVKDPKLTDELQVLLSQIDAKAVSTHSNDRLAVQANAANQLVASTHNLVQQVVNNQKCVLKRPGLLAGVGSLVANVGAAVTAINPAIGLGASAAGTLMSDMVNLVHQKKLTKSIRKLNDSSLKPEAISCVLESLTGDYCRAQDAITAIDWAQAHRIREDYPLTSPLFGLGLLDREVEDFTRWLGIVKVSRLAQNPADASRVQEFRNLETFYLNSPDLFSGTLGTYRSQLEGVTDMDKRWPIIRSMVTELATKLGAPSPYNMGNNGPVNPLFQTKNRNEAEFFLVGIDANKLDKPNNAVPNFEQGFSPKDLAHQTNPQTIRTDLKDIQAQFDAWFADTKVLVDDQRAQVTQPDVQGTLEAAFTKRQDYDRGGTARGDMNPPNVVFPYQSLLTITDYLQAQLDQHPRDSDAFYYLPDTISRLTQIRQDLDELHTTKKTQKDFGSLLADIYTQANLQNGSSFLHNRIADHINSALVRYLSDPENSRDASAILAQTLASDRMTDILTKTNPRGDRGIVREDILNSITIVLPTLGVFVDTFQKEIKSVLDFLQGQEVLYGGPKSDSGEAFYYKRAKICLLLTSLPLWPEKVPYSLCQGTSFSTLDQGPVSPVLTATYMSKPVDSRACGYFQLQRATLIHQAKLDFKSR